MPGLLDSDLHTLSPPHSPTYRKCPVPALFCPCGRRSGSISLVKGSLCGGSTRTTGFCFPPHSRGASVGARREPSMKVSSKGTSNVKENFQEDPNPNQSQLYRFPLFQLFLRYLSPVRSGPPKIPIFSSPVEALQNSWNSFQFFTPSIPLN